MKESTPGNGTNEYLGESKLQLSVTIKHLKSSGITCLLLEEYLLFPDIPAASLPSISAVFNDSNEEMAFHNSWL